MITSEMDKRFEPKSFEAKWQAFWQEQGLFEVDPKDGGEEGESFCIMIPPPNVTGQLHMGHALQSALQDLLVRWRRMQGANALWLPGTDHAGIATQLMVERAVAAEGGSREELGRKAFVERIWQWKHQYRKNIRSQLDQLGASCDWSRERFTLDEGLSEAVKTAFVRLYREGLISRGEYIVNWSPVLNTAVSDLEVESREVRGKLYHLAYPIEGSDETVVVATTRPETMLGDTGIAMAPGDERYQSLKGKFAVLPLIGRRLPFVEDELVDREFGSGLVKITPFHDPNDFEMGERHGLERVQVIDHRGRMTEAAGEVFAGLDRFEARQKVLERLGGEGRLIKVEEHVHNVGHSQRSGEPIEPLVSTQWFCDVSSMAHRALEAVEDGSLQLIPASWDKTWSHWLSNIRPWCISRQLWWGHQIPAWYTADGEVVVAESLEEAAAQAGTEDLRQDEDVLDTWFSSALWPFSTLGWPDEDHPDFRKFYPTDVLITGYDILFFWVARMVMTGLHFTDRLPFTHVHLTGLVRDAEGQKMSKTKGNTVDPLELVDEFGADALRFTLTILDSPGRDIPLDRERMAGYRAFGNKIWNATRFALARIAQQDDAASIRVQAQIDPQGLAEPERWILSRLSKTAAEVNAKFESFRFDEACQALYHFFWHELCDWYIELSKPALAVDAKDEEHSPRRPRVGEVLLTVLDRSLRLLHPVMPYLTEEVWQRLPGREAIDALSIVRAPYPEREPFWEDAEAEARMETLLEVITRVRALRVELGSATTVHLHLDSEDSEVAAFLARQQALVVFLTRVASVRIGPAPDGVSKDLVAGVEVGLEAEAVEMGEDERQRLEKEVAKLQGEIRAAEGRLSNPGFLANAPEEVVAGNRQRLEELQDRHRRLLESLQP